MTHYYRCVCDGAVRPKSPLGSPFSPSLFDLMGSPFDPSDLQGNERYVRYVGPVLRFWPPKMAKGAGGLLAPSPKTDEHLSPPFLRLFFFFFAYLFFLLWFLLAGSFAGHWASWVGTAKKTDQHHDHKPSSKQNELLCPSFFFLLFFVNQREKDCSALFFPCLSLYTHTHASLSTWKDGGRGYLKRRPWRQRA